MKGIVRQRAVLVAHKRDGGILRDVPRDVGPFGVSSMKTASAAPAQQASEARADVPEVQLLPGFEVQMLYEVPLEDKGSWVALAVGPGGELIASDQGDEGLYRIMVTSSIDDSEVNVEEMVMPISGVQGLEWGFDPYPRRRERSIVHHFIRSV